MSILFSSIHVFLGCCDSSLAEKRASRPRQGAEISTQAYAETLGDGAEKSIGYLSARK